AAKVMRRESDSAIPKRIAKKIERNWVRKERTAPLRSRLVNNRSAEADPTKGLVDGVTAQTKNQMAKTGKTMKTPSMLVAPKRTRLGAKAQRPVAIVATFSP